MTKVKEKPTVRELDFSDPFVCHGDMLFNAFNDEYKILCDFSIMDLDIESKRERLNDSVRHDITFKVIGTNVEDKVRQVCETLDKNIFKSFFISECKRLTSEMGSICEVRLYFISYCPTTDSIRETEKLEDYQKRCESVATKYDVAYDLDLNKWLAEKKWYKFSTRKPQRHDSKYNPRAEFDKIHTEIYGKSA